MAPQADSPIPPTSWAFDATAQPAGRPTTAAAAAGPHEGRLDQGRRPLAAGRRRRRRTRSSCSAPDADDEPGAPRRRRAGRRRLGRRSASRSTLVEPDPGALADRAPPRRASSPPRSSTSRSGYDPDLYPLLASSQTRTGGLNLIGLQDPTLDGLLAAARKPGDAEARKAAYTALQTQLAAGQYLLPIAFADEVVVARNARSGRGRPASRRPVGSFLGRANMAPRERPVSTCKPIAAGRRRGGEIGRRASFRS